MKDLKRWFRIDVWGPENDPRLGPMIDDLRSLKSMVELVVATLTNNAKEMAMVREMVDELKADMAHNHDVVESVKLLLDGLVTKVGEIATKLEETMSDNASVMELRDVVDTFAADTDALAQKVVEGTPSEK
jgi:septation ring formation regulator EzrA